MNQTERFVDAFQHESRRQVGMAAPAPRPRGSRASSASAYDPTGAMVASSELLSSAARLLRPVATPLSPIMTERSLSNHFDVLTMPLDLAKKVGNSIGGTLNDTFVGGIARGLHLYHRTTATSPTSLRMGMPINIRDINAAATAGNAFVPGPARGPDRRRRARRADARGARRAASPRATSRRTSWSSRCRTC